MKRNTEWREGYVPPMDAPYWYITYYGKIERGVWTEHGNTIAQMERMELGNFFRTKREAQAGRKTIIARMKALGDYCG